MPDWVPIDTAPMPAGTVRVKLPASEVCMHLGIAERDHWVAKLGDRMAQIYDDGGAPYTAPVLLSEAGLTDDGEPHALCEPTSCALTFIPRTPFDASEPWRLVVADDFDAAAFTLLVEPWLVAAPACSPGELGLAPADVTASAAFILRQHRVLGVAIERVHEQPTAQITFAQLCARLARSWSRPPLPGSSQLAVARAKIPFGSRERDGAKHRLAAWPIGEATAMAARLRHAGWIVHVVVERGHFALLARRRMSDIHAAVDALITLDAHGRLDLADATETRTLASVELGAPAHRDPATCG